MMECALSLPQSAMRNRAQGGVPTASQTQAPAQQDEETELRSYLPTSFGADLVVTVMCDYYDHEWTAT